MPYASVSRRFAQRRLDLTDEADLPDKMHGAVKRGRRRRNLLVQRQWLVGIDRVRADVNDMRRLHPRQRIKHRPDHDHVVDQHVHVFAGDSRGCGDDRVTRVQQGGELFCCIGS